MRKPYKYQEGIIERSVEREYTMVQAACGTGKSLISAQTAIRKGRHTLIITPKNVMDDFKDELIADGVPEEDIFVYRAADSHKNGYFEAIAKWLGNSLHELNGSSQEPEAEEDSDEQVIF